MMVTHTHTQSHTHTHLVGHIEESMSAVTRDSEGHDGMILLNSERERHESERRFCAVVVSQRVVGHVLEVVSANSTVSVRCVDIVSRGVGSQRIHPNPLPAGGHRAIQTLCVAEDMAPL